MIITNPTNGNPYPEDDDAKKRKDRIGANPPYRIGHTVRFRKLLAELIARRIIAARRGLPDAGHESER
jgi:hypothetical protein